MEDFLSRLVERTLGVAPVVQPLIASRFVSEPTSYLPDIEWDETKASDDLDRGQTPLTKETPPAPDGPTSRPEDAAVGHQEYRSNVAPTTPKRPQRTLDTQSDPHYPADSASIELGVIPIQEDRQSLSPGTPRRRRRTPEKPESFHSAKSGPTWRGDATVPTSPHKLPEDSRPDPNVAEGVSTQATPRLISSLVRRGRGATLPPQPLPITQGSLPESKETLDRTAPPDTPLVTPRSDTPLVTPSLVGLQPDDRLERGLQAPRKAVPEPSTPTIRVAIGRIEVRAITPPPTLPARRETPAPSSSALSLDDYLKQRNAGQR